VLSVLDIGEQETLSLLFISGIERLGDFALLAKNLLSFG
jgi:hypothetical protein